MIRITDQVRQQRGNQKTITQVSETQVHSAHGPGPLNMKYFYSNKVENTHIARISWTSRRLMHPAPKWLLDAVTRYVDRLYSNSIQYRIGLCFFMGNPLSSRPPWLDFLLVRLHSAQSELQSELLKFVVVYS